MLALVLPLSVDTFAVSAAVGLTGLSRREQLRLSLVLALFEAVMPLIGFTLGAALGFGLGAVGSYVASALLAGLGAYILRAEDDAVAMKI